ncbi:MAG: glycosyltransferase family 4 protein [Gemmatimonadetes bacterium]|nr:glycosyltransferase family 4 protein [Gemmatimonadota bacterium]
MRSVWILNHHAHDPVTGKWTRHFNLALELAAAGWEVTIIAASFEHGEGRQRIPGGDPWREETHHGVRFVWLRTPAYRGNGAGRVWNHLVYTGRALAQGMARRWGRPDVVVGTSAHLLAAWAGARLARWFGVPFLFEERDLWPSTLVDFGMLRAGSPVTRGLAMLERRLYRRAERIITVLPRAREHVEACGVSGEKVVWLPNGMRLADMPSAEPRDHDGPFVLLYLGSVGPAYGSEALVEAMGRLEREAPDRPVVLRLVGGGGPHKERLEAFSRQRGVGNVLFEAAIPKREIPRLAREADAMVVTVSDRPELYRYGISFNKIFDAMASGLPVLMASGAVNNPIADAGCGITVPAEDPEAFAAAVLRLARTPAAERAAMGQRGRAHIAEVYEYGRLGAQLAGILDEVTPGHARLQARGGGPG